MFTPVSSNASRFLVFSLRAVLAVLVIFAAVHFQGSLHAQVTGAIIQGIVTDPQGATIPNVRVTATMPATGQSYTAVTNTAGLYEFPALNPGTYTVGASATGFATYVRTNIELALQQRLRVDFALQLTSVEQSIDVSGTPTVVNTDSSSVSHLVGGEAVASLPTNGRNALWITRLVPGGNLVQAADGKSSFADTNAPSNVSFNGAPAQGNAYMLNGVADSSGNGRMAFVPSTYSVQEVNLQTFALTAEYGQTSGSVITFETKSGTNTPHGALWYYNNQEAFNANDFFSNKVGATKTKNRNTNLGGNVGGPVYIPGIYNGKNRTFFFTDYDSRRDRQAQQFTNSVPTALERTGDFSQTRTAVGQLIQIYNPFTTRFDPANPTVQIRDPFAGNRIPQAMIEPIATNILKYADLPNLPGSFNNQFYQQTRPIVAHTSTTRIDHRLSDRHTLNGSFTRVIYHALAPGSVPPLGVNGYWNNRYGMFGTLAYVWVVNPSTVFNVRAGLMRHRERADALMKPADRASLGFPKSFESIINAPEFPRISSSDMTALGYRNDGKSFITPNLRAFITKVVGRHSVTFGYEHRTYRTFEFSHQDEGGFFSFTRSWTQGPRAATASATAGYGVATLLLGTPSSGSILMNASNAVQSLYHALYIQDTWRLTQKLTVNVGLRYDYQTPMTERFNRMNYGFDFTSASPIAQQVEANYAKNPLPQRTTPFRVVGGLGFVGGESRYNFEPVRNMFMPRAGLAYQFNAKTVARGGYGFYCIPLVDARIVNTNNSTQPLSQLGFSSTTTMNTSLGGLPLDQLKNPFPQGQVQPVGSSLGLATLLGQSVSVYDSQARRGKTHQYQFSIQREIPWKMMLDVGYVGSRSANLPVDENVNSLPPEYLPLRDTVTRQVANPFAGVSAITVGTLAAATVATSQLLLPYPHYTGLTIQYRPIGSSWYHSLQTGVDKRFGKELRMRVAYTLSKMLERRSFLNPYDPLETRIAQIDRPHRFIYSGQWSLPVGKGMRFGGGPKLLQAIVGNWDLLWVATIHSGLPTGSWPTAIVTRSPQSVKPTVDKWFDTSAFAAQPAYTLRTLSTYDSHIRADGLQGLDLSIAKDFPVREAVRFRVKVDMFNAFNTPQFTAPNLSVTNAAFGTVTSQANDPRNIVLSASFHF